MTAVLLRSSSVLDFQLELRIALALVERLAFPFERCDTLLQFRLVQKVGIAGEQRHVLREVHARFLVHSPLVDGTCAHRPLLSCEMNVCLQCSRLNL